LSDSVREGRVVGLCWGELKPKGPKGHGGPGRGGAARSARARSCDRGKYFHMQPPRGPASMGPCGTLVGQGQYIPSLLKHSAPPEPSPETSADQVGVSRARGARSANQTLSATRGDAAECAARSRAGIQSRWHGTPVVSVLTLKRIRGTAWGGCRGLLRQEPHSQLHSTRPSRRKDCRESIYAFGSRFALHCRGSCRGDSGWFCWGRSRYTFRSLRF